MDSGPLPGSRQILHRTPLCPSVSRGPLAAVFALLYSSCRSVHRTAQGSACARGRLWGRGSVPGRGRPEAAPSLPHDEGLMALRSPESAARPPSLPSPSPTPSQPLGPHSPAALRASAAVRPEGSSPRVWRWCSADSLSHAPRAVGEDAHRIVWTPDRVWTQPATPAKLSCPRTPDVRDAPAPCALSCTPCLYLTSALP